MIYEIMRKDTSLATINMEDGSVKINGILPIGLVLINTNNNTSIKDRIKNISNFKSWCAGRLLMMNQKHAKKICNALALSQDMSDDNKMKIALIYKCTTLQDAFWVKEKNDNIRYNDVSLFRNESHNILTPVSLRGESSIFNKVLKNWVDVGTDGTLAKSWIRKNGQYYLLKKSDNFEGEILAGKIGKMLELDCVEYTLEEKPDITICKCFTNEDIGFIPYGVFVRQFSGNAIGYIKDNYIQDYANLAVFTYLVGNEDLHDRNWGLKINNNTGKIIGLSTNFDFDGCFLNTYKTSENNYFLPECEYIDKNNHLSQKYYDFDIDSEISIIGPTIKDMALKYVSMSTLNLDNIDLSIIPDKFKNIFINRLENINIIKGKNNIILD